MEGSDDAALKFSSLVSSDGNWGEALPEDRLANVGGDEKRDTRAESITFLEELVKHKDHESSQEELSNDKN